MPQGVYRRQVLKLDFDRYISVDGMDSAQQIGSLWENREGTELSL
jgi:hypothetical protein